MYKITIFSIGKTKEKWLQDAIEEYFKRLKPIAQFEFILAKDDAHLIDITKNEKELICLDSQGQMMTSEEFSVFVHEQLQRGGSRLSFVIGGPEGLPQALKSKKALLSFSPLTFTHQLVRLILVEQLYRAFEIEKGSSYHK